MNKAQIWVAIIGGGVVTSLGIGAIHYPGQAALLAMISGFITALVAYITNKSST